MHYGTVKIAEGAGWNDLEEEMERWGGFGVQRPSETALCLIRAQVFLVDLLLLYNVWLIGLQLCSSQLLPGLLETQPAATGRSQFAGAGSQHQEDKESQSPGPDRHPDVAREVGCWRRRASLGFMGRGVNVGGIVCCAFPLSVRRCAGRESGCLNCGDFRRGHTQVEPGWLYC